MELQIRMSRLSKWQMQRESEYEDAVAILRRAGISAEYRSVVVADDSEEPGYIVLRKGSR